MPVRNDFLGKGLAFPLRFEKTGRLAVAEGEPLIRMSIRQILGTRTGSRVILRTFGSRLRDLIFDPINGEIDVLVQHGVREALEIWERRIRVGPVTVDKRFAQDGQLEISVRFLVIQTNVTGNLVYPFFLSPDEAVRISVGPSEVT